MSKKGQPKESSYSYSLNAGLVVSGQNKDTGERISRKQLENMPTGEAESLVGRQIASFGDRVAYSKPTEEAEQQDAAKQKQAKHDDSNDYINSTIRAPFGKGDESIQFNTLTVNQELVYRPKTRETKQIYEKLLHTVQRYLGDVSTEVLLDCADELIILLKNDQIQLARRKQELEALLGLTSSPLPNESFNQLVVLTQLLSDFESIDAQQMKSKQEIEDLQEIAIDDESEEDGRDQIQHHVVEDEEMIPLREPQQPDKEEDEVAVQIAPSKQPGELEITDLNADWIKEKLKSSGIDKPLEAESKVLEIIGNKELTARDVEKKLIVLLTPKRIDLIKHLVSNRYPVFYGVLYHQAETEQEKNQVQMLMRQTPDGRQLLMKLKIGAASKTASLLMEAEDQIMMAKQTETKPTINDRQMQMDNLEIINLDELKFQQGPRVMTNSKCVLPKGSTRLAKAGYEEVYVPAKRAKTSTDSLVPIASLPEWARAAFPSYMTHLNRIQSVLCQKALTTPDNLLVCAPTGAGKTNIAMLTCLQLMSEMRTQSPDGRVNYNLSKFKIIYIAPMKALVTEVVGNFQARLQSFGMKVRELTGDAHLSKQQIEETNIIVTTPEKWDIITRKSGERAYLELVKLVIVDEVHLLHDSRGPVLEAIIARTIRQIEESSELVRIVGLSATLPNYQDVAALLRVDPQSGLFFFDSSFRPVPLEQIFVGITEKKAVKRLLLMNEVCYEKTLERVEKHQIIIFVHSRKETARTARAIREMAAAQDKLGLFAKEGSESKKILTQVIEDQKQATSKDLQFLVPFGFGIHHAGLSKEDRTLVEDLFAAGHIRVLVSTATLAWGVNLPAHTVIIKGTQVYSPEQGQWIELSPQDVLQMMGRAGRPQYDTLGEGIIITQHSDLQYYLSLNNQQLPIESQMITALADQMNAEVVLGSVSNLKEAVNWISYTYLYIRIRRNPELYGVDAVTLQQDPNLIQTRLNLVHSAALKLHKAGMVKYDKKSGTLLSTAIGKVASHFYIKCNSMQMYNDELKPHMGPIDIFRLFALSKEFENIPIRESERIELQRFIDRVPVPVKGSMDETATKINVLLQAHIARFRLDGYDLNADMVYVTQSGSRIMRALFEIALKKGWAMLADHLLNACKMIEKRQWYSMTPLRQFANAPSIQDDDQLVKDLNDIARRIERKEQFKWVDFYDFTAQQLGELVKYPKMGRVILSYVHRFPRLEISAFVQPITRGTLKIELELKTHKDFIWDSKFHGTAEPFWVFVHDCDCEQIIHSDLFMLTQNGVGQEHQLSFHVPLFDPLPPQYFVKVVSDRWLQAEHVIPISFKNLILPDKYPAPTEFEDAEPRPIADLDFDEAQQVYEADNLKEFSPLVSQCFDSIYNSNQSAFFGIPSGGSEKRILSEIAIFREIQNENFGKIVYVAPHSETCQVKFQNWRRRLGEDGLGLNIELLSADYSESLQDDLAKVVRADLILASAAKWDWISRRRECSQQIGEIGLFILDDVQCIIEDPAMEVLMSKTKQMQSQKPIRIVALSQPIANSRDVSEWLEIKPQFCFNFNLSVRARCPSQGPMQLNITAFDHHNRHHRLLQMSKPVFHQLKRNLRARTIIFTPDTQQARKLTRDLISFSIADDNEGIFLGKLREADEKYEQEVLRLFSGEGDLQEQLLAGIGCLSANLSPQKSNFIKSMFRKGKVRVIISASEHVWSLGDLYAEMVIIQDPERYNAQLRRYEDLPLSQLTELMSLCCTTNPKAMARCIILCHSSKKNFLGKFVQEPLPLESSLHLSLHDLLLSEFADSKPKIQDVIDWLTKSFLYRRIIKNPNYYEISGRTPQHINDFLSELVEDCISDLCDNQCITLDEDEMFIDPTGLTKILVDFNVKFETLRLILDQLNQLKDKQMQLKTVLQLLCCSKEFAKILNGTVIDLNTAMLLAFNLPIDLPPDYDIEDSSIKANILLQSHFSRKPLPIDLTPTKMRLCEAAVPLVHALVQILVYIQQPGCLKAAITAMEVSQMVVQASWINMSPLLQLPYLTRQHVERLKAAGISDIADFMNMDDGLREKLVPLPADRMQQVAEVCNRFPNFELNLTNLKNGGIKATKGGVEIQLVIKRDINEEDFETREEFLEELATFKKPVPTLDFSNQTKQEVWWLLVGHPASQSVLKIQRLTTLHLQAQLTQKLSINDDLESLLASEPKDHQRAGTLRLKTYLICDSFLGADLEKEFVVQLI